MAIQGERADTINPDRKYERCVPGFQHARFQHEDHLQDEQSNNQYGLPKGPKKQLV